MVTVRAFERVKGKMQLCTNVKMCSHIDFLGIKVFQPWTLRKTTITL
jgi:hypothetical protein